MLRTMVLPVLASAVLELMTYNVLYSNQDPDLSLDAIAAADADVVLLQEVTSRWETRLEKRFEKQYPHRRFHVGGPCGRHRRARGPGSPPSASSSTARSERFRS
jgi:endonuclease/exonuclease/phosphatase (EEP) superfamily protein YafD